MHLRDVFANGSGVEISGVTRMPFTESIFEFDFHEMTGDGSDKHVALLAINGVVELEYLVVPGPSVSHSKLIS